MTTRSTVAGTMLAILALLVGLDLWAAMFGRRGDTVTELVDGAARERPIVPFIGGMIAGHFFWNRPR